MNDSHDRTDDRPDPEPSLDAAAAQDASAASLAATVAPPDAPHENEPPPVTRKKWIAAAAAALGVALFASALLGRPDRGHDDATGAAAAGANATGGTCAASKGRANFDLTLKDPSGADVRLSDYKGKVVLLNFWATWCGPCKVEIPEFVEAYRHYRDRGFVILGVLSQDDPAPQELREFTSAYNMNYPVFKQNEELEDAFGSLWALPTSFIIDRSGSICTKHMGPVSREMLEREIKGLL